MSKSTEEPNPRPMFWWNTLNSVAVAVATSSAIVAVQGPLKTITFNLLQNGTAFPATSGGIYGAAKAFYTGSGMAFSGSTARSVYVANVKSAKGSEPLIIEENGKEPTKGVVSNSSLVASAMGERFVMQIPGAYSDLQKANIITPAFRWNIPNTYHLMTMRLGVHSAASLVNFGALCIIDDKIADKMTFTNPKVTHYLSGALTGVAATLINYPLAIFSDHAQLQTRLNNQYLVPKKSIPLSIELLQEFKKNPNKSAQIFLQQAAKQLPIRMLSGAAVFSIISGINDSLGSHPLENIVPKQYQPYSQGNKNCLFNSSKSEKTTEASPQSKPPIG